DQQECRDHEERELPAPQPQCEEAGEDRDDDRIGPLQQSFELARRAAQCPAHEVEQPRDVVPQELDELVDPLTNADARNVWHQDSSLLPFSLAPAAASAVTCSARWRASASAASAPRVLICAMAASNDTRGTTPRRRPRSSTT